MAKSKAEVASIPYSPPTRIRLTKDQAGEISVGDKVSVTVSGEVVGIHANMGYTIDNAEKIEGYEVELRPSKVTSISGNPAQRALKELKGK